MRKYLILLALIALSLSPACATRQQSGAVVGAAAGGAVGNVVTRGSFAGTLIGAIVGGAFGSEIGRQLDEADRRRVAYALEYTPTGQAYGWTNPDSGYRYELEPRRTYRGPQGPCRDYVIDTRIDGEPAEIQGTACRYPDGMWRAVQ